jgi:small subunit ribosomal protein S9
MSAKSKIEEFIATGRRKTSTARVRIRPGSGDFIINNRDISDYCSTEQQKKAVLGPLVSVEKVGELDITVIVRGGGGTGQSGAIRHGLSRALEKMDGELRSPLKKAGHLRRDPRKIERKKPGRPGARKRFQFSKR